MHNQHPNNHAIVYPQPPAFHASGQPVLQSATPALPPGTISPLPGFVPWEADVPQQLAHWAGSHSDLMLWGPQAYACVPWVPLPYSSPLFNQPAAHLGTPPSPPPVAKPNWRPSANPPPSHPNEIDRNDEWENKAQADPEPAIDHLSATINHWATCASEWSAKDPSLAETFQWGGLHQYTRAFLRQFLRPNWLHTGAVMAHARLFCPDFSALESIYWMMRIVPAAWGKSDKKFLCWLMLDFYSVDPSLDDLVIAAGIEQARTLGCLRYFERLVLRELKLKPAHLKRLKANAVRMLADAKNNGSIAPAQSVTSL